MRGLCQYCSLRKYQKNKKVKIQQESFLNYKKLYLINFIVLLIVNDYIYRN